MKAIISTAFLTVAAFSTSGCAFMIGDTMTGYGGYSIDNGRCSQTVSTSKQTDGTTTTTREVVCKPETTE